MAAPAEHHRGEMEISEQVSTFHAFIAMSKWGSLAMAVSLVFLTLLFCTSAGLFQSLIAAVVIAVAGGWLLRDKPTAGH